LEHALKKSVNYGKNLSLHARRELMIFYSLMIENSQNKLVGKISLDF
jgi:hypothetical protein